MIDKMTKKISSLSEFVEKPNKKIFGFTITYETGEITNHFIYGNRFPQSDRIEELRKMYKRLKENKNSKGGQNV